MGQNKYTQNPRVYNKTNFVDLLELLTPEVYRTEDLTMSGVEVNPLSNVINTHLVAADNISTVLSISAVANSQTSSLDNISGISQYFVKQNELTLINPYLFETKILNPLSSTFRNFDASSDFNTYLSGTLLPSIRLATGDDASILEANITTLSSLTENANASSVHNYLVDTLGWFYFLNTSADGGLTWDPSGYVLSSLNSLYVGKDLDTYDGIVGFENYLWRNYSTCTTFSNLGLIPASFTSGAADAILESSAGVVATYTSGIQKLENLLTLIDVIYSPLYIDQEDYTVKNAFDDYISASLKLTNQIAKGPYRKFLTALGYSFADLDNEVDNIGLIYDIENCRDDNLQHIAELIGWKLLGNSPAKWRHQLRTAVEMYKRSGTKDAIQYAVNSLIINSVFDLSGKVDELWESYIPFLIWYALGTESPYFRDLRTWTPGLSIDAGVFAYNTSSLEENLKLATDSILFDLYKAFPDNFLFHGNMFPVARLLELDLFGCTIGDPPKVYTLQGGPQMKPFHCHRPDDPGYTAFEQDAYFHGEGNAWRACHSSGVLGYGAYMANEAHPTNIDRPLYLSSTGDLGFVFNYRGRENYPIPPFEEIKYYRDSTVTAPLVKLLKNRLVCFGVPEDFANEVETFILSASVTSETNIGSLNEFLMFFKDVQIPPNYDNVIRNISNYQKNLLGLWNGKSSHIFIDFKDADFNFAKTTLEGDSKNALIQSSRIIKDFTPAHTINRINVNASASDNYSASSTRWEYLGFDNDDTRAYYTSASILGNFEYSGVDMGALVTGGGGDANLDGDAGRGGLNTFKRPRVDNITDTLLSSTTAVAALSNVPRRALRRRTLKYLLPKEGFYTRTGFNAPSLWDASALENSMPSSLGELTLGWVASAGQYYPLLDPVNPSGIWHFCEGLDSSRTFSGVDTSNTFPYRGLVSVGQSNNQKMPELSPSTTRYVDRGQLPLIYRTMHNLFELKAIDYAEQQILLDTSAYVADAYWKNNIQSFANLAIASGLLLNSQRDYENFSFGINLNKLFKDYKKYYPTQNLSLTEVDETGGNIFAQVFDKGIYNCDFSLEGSAVETLEGDYVASSVSSTIPISYNQGSGVFSTCAVAAYGPGIASGSYIASDVGEMVVPLIGSYTSGNPYNAEFRNPHILSGIEFVNTSGASTENLFKIFKIDQSFKVPGLNNYLVNNPVIKCKTFSGFPRLRFDLSAYGDRRNYFIKNHQFKLSIDALIADETSYRYGGGQIGVWIHTDTVGGVEPTSTANDRYMWTWGPQNKWILHLTSDLSIETVKGMSHMYTFPLKEYPFDVIQCLGNTDTGVAPQVEDITLHNIQKEYFETFEINFDTRNYTIYNNFEYLDIIPVPEKFYKLRNLVNTEDTNYIVEIFYLKPALPQRYLLIDDIRLEDSTLRDWAGIGTGHGTETSGIPLRKFVHEDKLYLNKENLRDVLKFFNGITGENVGVSTDLSSASRWRWPGYATPLASRDATITSATMELSGGSRLNYRTNLQWGAYSTNTTNSYSSYKNVEFDN